MKVGDQISAEHDGQAGSGLIEAVAGNRVFVRLTVRPGKDWTSPVTGGTVPAGCPISYLLWFPSASVHPVD